MINIWVVLAIFWSGALSLAIGMVGGGVLVLITKREAHELAFLTGRKSSVETGPINIDELADGEEQPENIDDIPDIFVAKHADFISQVAKEGRARNAAESIQDTV